MRGKGIDRQTALILVLVLGIIVELPLAVWAYNRWTAKGSPSQAVTVTGTSIGSRTPHPIAGKFKPDKTKLSDCSEQACYEQAYGNLAYYEGPKVALTLVAKQYAGGADPSCHRVVHMIGAATLERNHGNVARTFAQGSSLCWAGYYHGILERAFATLKSYTAAALGAKARTICADPLVRNDRWLDYQCLHGLGHGLMITTGYQLPLALKVCQRLPAEWDQTSCKSGVFMENVVSSYGGESPWVKDDDPLYPCDSVAKSDKFACYQLAVTRFFRLGMSWTEAAQLCAKADKGFAGTCFGSFGQNASLAAKRDPRGIRRLCAMTRRYGGESDCIRVAAKDMTGAFLSGERAARLCTTTAPSLRGTCFNAIGNLLGTLKSSAADRRAACASIARTRRDSTDCLQGTTGKQPPPGLVRPTGA